LAVEEGASEPVLDLGRRPVLIATEDEAFAGALAALFAAWNADARWVGGADDALAALARHATPERPLMVPVLIIDGSRKLLSALSLAHRAARVGGPAPYVLLVADPGQIERLDEVDEGEVDGFIPLPLGDQLLANALSALPLGQPIADRPRLRDPQRGPPGKLAEQFGEPIAPKFISEPRALDMRAIDGLRELSGDPDFLGELIASFRADAQQIMERLNEAVATADAVGFAQNLTALRRAASPLGATQLCDLLASLQGLDAGELRQLGASHVRRLDAEVERFAAALTEIVTPPEARSP
jgi:HPt (histidine-containing phosphotransfer) domain-containing protein